MDGYTFAATALGFDDPAPGFAVVRERQVRRAFCNVAGIQTCASAISSHPLLTFTFAGGVKTSAIGALPFGCKAFSPHGEALALTDLPETWARDGAGPDSEAHHLAAEALQLTSKAILSSADGMDRNAEANCCAGEGKWWVSGILFVLGQCDLKYVDFG